MTDWNELYLKNETPWDRAAPSPALLTWLPDLQPCRILVPGCGRGYEVEELSERGFDVSALDISPVALHSLKLRLEKKALEAQVMQADVLTWLPKEPVDLVFEQTCLCALQPAKWAAYSLQLWKWLKPGGLLLACFMQTGRDGGPPFDCPLESMRDYFPAHKWKWPETSPQRFERADKDLYELALILTKL